MPSWNQLLAEFEVIKDPNAQKNWLTEKINRAFQIISSKREKRNVIFYCSAYLQKPGAHPYTIQITPEDLNGFMSNIHGLNCDLGLTLILHTPGGITNAAETIIDYLHRKFSYIEVVIPAFAMSAGTMISLCSHNIIMGKQSQMGPIDPQLPINGNRYASALSIRNQFKRAQTEINEHKENAHVWAPILASLGPALLQEAENAISYGEGVVQQWLQKVMFAGNPEAKILAQKAAEYFSQCEKNTSHGRRINIDEAQSLNLNIENLENDQQFQDAIMTLYHLITIFFEKSPACKIIANNKGNTWIKNSPIPIPVNPQQIKHIV